MEKKLYSLCQKNVFRLRFICYVRGGGGVLSVGRITNTCSLKDEQLVDCLALYQMTSYLVSLQKEYQILVISELYVFKLLHVVMFPSDFQDISRIFKFLTRIEWGKLQFNYKEGLMIVELLLTGKTSRQEILKSIKSASFLRTRYIIALMSLE